MPAPTTHPALTPAQNTVRDALADRTRAHTVASLAAATGLGHSTVSAALRRLEALHLATRSSQGRDAAGTARPDHWAPPPAPSPRPARCSSAHAPNTASSAGHRRAPGELKAAVLDHFTTHRDQQFKPHEIAKVLGASAGAVINNCNSLTRSGALRRVVDSPATYQAASQPDTP